MVEHSTLFLDPFSHTLTLQYKPQKSTFTCDIEYTENSAKGDVYFLPLLPSEYFLAVKTGFCGGTISGSV